MNRDELLGLSASSMYYHRVAVDPEDWAWQFFRAAGKINGVNAAGMRMGCLGNPYRRGLPGFIATPVRFSFVGHLHCPILPVKLIGLCFRKDSPCVGGAVRLLGILSGVGCR